MLIIISSLTFILAKRALKNGNKSLTTINVIVNICIRNSIYLYQFYGFGQIVASGYNFTGPTSNVTMSFIYVIAFVHILHVIAGLISLLVVIYNHFKQKYSNRNARYEPFSYVLAFYRYTVAILVFVFIIFSIIFNDHFIS